MAKKKKAKAVASKKGRRKKVAPKAKLAERPSKGVHKDLYIESEDDPRTSGMWDKIQTLVKGGFFPSASAVVRHALILLMDQYKHKKMEHLHDDQKLNNYGDIERRVTVRKVGNEFRFLVHNLKKDECVMIQSRRWARNGEGKAVRDTDGYTIKPTKNGLVTEKVK